MGVGRCIELTLWGGCLLSSCIVVLAGAFAAELCPFHSWFILRLMNSEALSALLTWNWQTVVLYLVLKNGS